MSNSFTALTTILSNERPHLQEVYVSPCSPSKDTFSVCALTVKDGSPTPHFFEESCLSGCYRGEETVDFEEELKKLRQKYSVLYTHFAARNLRDIPGSFVLQASLIIGRNSAITVICLGPSFNFFFLSFFRPGLGVVL